MPQGNPFRSSNRSAMGSNYLTDINQGGGEKKAGYPYQIGREYMSSVFIKNRPLSVYTTTVFPLANQSRPIGTLSRTNNSYWHIPGTGAH